MKNTKRTIAAIFYVFTDKTPKPKKIKRRKRERERQFVNKQSKLVEEIY